MVVQVIDAPDLAHSHILWIFPPYLVKVGEKDLNQDQLSCKEILQLLD